MPRLHTREDSGLVLDREGRWFHDGLSVEHPNIVEVFNRGVGRDEQGRYRLSFGDDWCFITVEDAPVQVELALPDDEGVTLRLSNGVVEPLDPSTLSLRADVLYCATRAGLPARFGRSAQFALGERLEERPDGWVLVVGGREFQVARGA